MFGQRWTVGSCVPYRVVSLVERTRGVWFINATGNRDCVCRMRVKMAVMAMMFDGVAESVIICWR